MRHTIRRDPEEFDAIEYLDSHLATDTKKLPAFGLHGTYAEFEQEDGKVLKGPTVMKWRTAGGVRRKDEDGHTQYHRPMIEFCNDTSSTVYNFTNAEGDQEDQISGSALKLGSYVKVCGPCMDLAYSSTLCAEHGAERWELPVSVRGHQEGPDSMFGRLADMLRANDPTAAQTVAQEGIASLHRRVESMGDPFPGF